MTLYFFISLTFFSIIDIVYLYDLLDYLFLFSTQGSKLRKYINKVKMPDNQVTINLKTKINTFKQTIISEKYRKHLISCIIIYITLLILNISILYDFFNSSFIYVKFFSKGIDLVSSYGSLFSIIKVFYIISYMSFLYIIIYKVLKYVLKNTNKNIVENVDKLSLNIGYYEEKINNTNECIIHEKGLFQNILITGSIGSGKTSSAIYNILDQLVRQDLGGLILDVKGNFIDTVKELLIKYNRIEDLKVIGIDSRYSYNPLDNSDISAAEIAYRLKNVLTLLSVNNTSDSYWLDKAASTLECFIILCRYYNDNAVNFDELNKLVIDTNYLNSKINIIKERVLNNLYNEKDIFTLNYAINYIKKEYFSLDSRVLSIIKSEITRITAPFISDYKVYNSFCNDTKEKFRINVNSKEIIVLSINMSDYKYIAKIIATYLKQDFQRAVLANIKNNFPIFFICDEYQEFASKDDANFLSLSREAECINVISMQSYSSLKNTLKDEDATRIIIQNCINKIWFRNDDIFTIQEVIKQIGKCEIDKETESYSENSKGTNYSILSNKFRNSNTNISESHSISKVREYRYDEKFFTQELKTFEALAFISDGCKVSYPQKISLKRMEEDK